MAVTREQVWPLFYEWYSNRGWKYVSSREGAFITWKAARADLEATIAEQAKELTDLRLQCITDFGQCQEAHEKVAEQVKEIRELKRLDFRGMREMLRAMQAGELTVSRGIEILDMWHAGNWNNDMLPHVRQDLIEEDSMPVEIIDRLRKQLQASLAREAQLREAANHVVTNGLGQHSIVTLMDALAIPSDDTALREYGAKLVEKISGMTLSTYALKQIANQIREGTFK